MFWHGNAGALIINCTSSSLLQHKYSVNLCSTPLQQYAERHNAEKVAEVNQSSFIYACEETDLFGCVCRRREEWLCGIDWNVTKIGFECFGYISILIGVCIYCGNTLLLVHSCTSRMNFDLIEIRDVICVNNISNLNVCVF